MAAYSTPTVVKTNDGQRTGVVLYDNSGITNDNQPSVYVIFRDMTFDQFARANLTNVAGAPTGNAALGYVVGLGPGN
jgi:hypothetical protein